MSASPERECLGERLDRAGFRTLFWEEPSRARGSAEEPPGFSSALASAEESLRRFGRCQLLAHSFGANYAAILANRHPELVSGVTLLAPSLAARSAQDRLLRLAAGDLRGLEPETAARLEAHARASQDAFDAEALEAIALALRDPLLFTHYFASPARLESWAALCRRPGAGLDPESFWGVLRSYRPPIFWLAALPHQQVPAQLLLGESDPIVCPASEEQAVRSFFALSRKKVIPGSGHFPQFEQPELLLHELECFSPPPPFAAPPRAEPGRAGLAR